MSDSEQIFRSHFTHDMEARFSEINKALSGPQQVLAQAIEARRQALAAETEDMREAIKKLENQCNEDIRKMEVKFQNDQADLINERDKLSRARSEASHIALEENCCSRSQDQGHWPRCIYCGQKVD